jgi:hypothetical protein
MVEDPRPSFRLRQLQQHLGESGGAPATNLLPAPPLALSPCKAADNTAVPEASKVVSAEEAVALIPDGVWLTPAGFVGTSCPEALLNAVRCASR